MDIFFVEETEEGYTRFEYLCTNCMSYLQEIYDGPTKVGDTWGDLRSNE